MKTDFTRADHTILLSDIHLADAEPPHPGNPLWKRFKRRRYFIDKSFRRFIDHLMAAIPAPIELILNGDIFDFDSVLTLPSDSQMQVSWLERKRGLTSEEQKSRFKISVILNDHPDWVDAIKHFVNAGNRVVFVIGNHDMELHWPSVQEEVLSRMELSPEACERVRFCEWFYISNQDTLIEHGNQYDDYCLCSNPINPLIKKGGKVFVRLPFGNLAGKYMLNGMGLFNPHAESSFIKTSLKEYIVFFYKYAFLTQPFLVLTWFWSAMVTMILSITEGLLPALKDPLTVGARIEQIAQKANASPRMVMSLRELHVHPAIYNPLKILRELWLDRALLFILIAFVCFVFYSFLNVFVSVSFWWFLIPFLLCLPIFIFYAKSIESELHKVQKFILKNAPLASRMTKVNRVIHGHTHHEGHTWVEGVEVLNTGTWSPAYRDVECTQPFGRKCFAWIKPRAGGTGRVAELHEWKDPGSDLIMPEA